MSIRKIELENTNYSIQTLQWDSDYFGIKCGKAILKNSLTTTDWDELSSQFDKYQFTSIVNLDSDPGNARYIGQFTKAFLADVNIQFSKEPSEQNNIDHNVSIDSNHQYDERIIEIANFKFSRFFEDPNFSIRGGLKIYNQWLINAFEDPNKYFAVYRSNNNEIMGFALHTYNSDICTIQLIAVDSLAAKTGIGTSIFKNLEKSAFDKACHQIRVGTQIRNINAINFYHKVGFRQTECNQIYHLWNLQ